jgi:hypothetical protein
MGTPYSLLAIRNSHSAVNMTQTAAFTVPPQTAIGGAAKRLKSLFLP